MNTNSKMTLALIALLSVTLCSSLLGIEYIISPIMVVVICLISALKGKLVIDYLMQMRTAPRFLYISLTSYFLVLPLLFVLAWWFPEQLFNLTSL